MKNAQSWILIALGLAGIGFLIYTDIKNSKATEEHLSYHRQEGERQAERHKLQMAGLAMQNELLQQQLDAEPQIVPAPESLN